MIHRAFAVKCKVHFNAHLYEAPSSAGKTVRTSSSHRGLLDMFFFHFPSSVWCMFCLCTLCVSDVVSFCNSIAHVAEEHISLYSAADSRVASVLCVHCTREYVRVIVGLRSSWKLAHVNKHILTGKCFWVFPRDEQSHTYFSTHKYMCCFCTSTGIPSYISRIPHSQVNAISSAI